LQPQAPVDKRRAQWRLTELERTEVFLAEPENPQTDIAPPSDESLN
jgi:hypothetical protein